MKHTWVYFYFVLFLLVLVHVALYCHTPLYLLFCARHCIFKTIYEIIKQYYICFCQVPMGHEFQDRFDPISVLEIFQITQRSCNHTAIHVRTSLLLLYLYTPSKAGSQFSLPSQIIYQGLHLWQTLNSNTFVPLGSLGPAVLSEILFCLLAAFN